jgi:Fe-S-cluster containining protein
MANQPARVTGSANRRFPGRRSPRPRPALRGLHPAPIIATMPSGSARACRIMYGKERNVGQSSARAIPQPNGQWYAAGLAFECRQSGNCCSGEPGYVWVTKAEVAAIADYLQRPNGQLGKRYIRRVGLRTSLKEKPDGDCVFLERGAGGCTTCRIHPVKPTQCRTWPFWDSNLKSPQHWNDAARTCPGMNQGPRHDFVTIETQRLRKPPR